MSCQLSKETVCERKEERKERKKKKKVLPLVHILKETAGSVAGGEDPFIDRNTRSWRRGRMKY